MLDLIRQLKGEHQGDQDGNNRPTQPLLESTDTSPTERNFSCSNASLSCVYTIIPIALIIGGVIHLHDCPAENMIAISFIVLGGVVLVLRCLNCPYEYRCIFGGEIEIPKNKCVICLALILEIVIISVIIAMSYWTFTINPDTKPEDHESANYCELQFYRSTYWFCVFGLVLFGLLFCFICCMCAAACIIAINEE